MVGSAQKVVTVGDLERMADDQYRYDLIDGVLIRMSPAGAEHGEIGNAFGRHLGNFVAEHDLGKVYAAETGFLLAKNPDVVLAPDAAFVRGDRLPPREERRSFLSLAPDLVVEIVSPSDRWQAVMEKVARYLRAGTRLVWVVNPRDQTLLVFRAEGSSKTLHLGDEIDGEDVLPGFRLPLRTVFG